MGYKQAMESVKTERLLRQRDIYKFDLQREKQKSNPREHVIKGLKLRISIIESVLNEREKEI